MAWESRKGRKTADLPRISVSGGGRPAAEVLSEIARVAGFKGYSWVRGGGIWFYHTRAREGSAASRWQTSTVRAYPLTRLHALKLLPGALVYAIRKEVAPESWNDPATLCLYYRHLDKLIVINSPDVQDKVLRHIHRMMKIAAEQQH